MPQTVVEKKLYADMLNPVISNRTLYPFAEIMGKVNIPGTNYRYNGERSIVITDIVAGKDIPANLQTYNANATQQWSNTEETLTIRYSREYRDFIDKEYVVTGKPLNTAANIMAKYERTGRPETISSQYGENLFNIATDNDTFFDEEVTTPAEAKAMFDKMNNLRMENDSGEAILYCTNEFKNLLRDYIAPSRRWSNDGKVSYDVSVIDDVIIKAVPNKYLKSNYAKTSGYTPDADALQMNAVLVSVNSIISPFILDDIYIDEPSALSGGKAFILSRFAFDLFVHPNAKDYGVIVNYTTPTTPTPPTPSNPDEND